MSPCAGWRSWEESSFRLTIKTHAHSQTIASLRTLADLLKHTSPPNPYDSEVSTILSNILFCQKACSESTRHLIALKPLAISCNIYTRYLLVLPFSNNALTIHT